ncbi:hypothetical protein AAZX31_07G201400 [Glycine max]|uniref:Uncharacterized protein n=2 Tax=Glycine subgen. Soja TaxID=1462606 RepID=I1KM54_SOYBN|nr:uncharacterized protein LOC100786207 [Glycine max]XP_028241325.1 uncharacterized protein LOC114419747 [Glycine soja]KAG5010826.1 hypothetical protein JHK87_019341 [Glycine soja]KAG5023565.1 hypothetical protein JHK85_019907 [Glycine max]KAG5038643.1 hypothetical protein JHK86_019483 [Glycine max]KAG5143772.1 hypothetical protein JHK82_019467 [Glycine max]KAH1087997.1 hypothetical protein GYH30_019187 [Glycine max]|eukprot:XP_003529413.1 uncharacterized protein LOC100786207 [Glycine max]
MSRRPHAPPPPPPPRPLYKQQSWSPDTLRDEAWQRRKDNSHHISGDNHRCSHRLSKSLSEDDLDELKACFELGFGFDSPEIDPKLSNTIPALELYHAVNKQYNHHSLSRSSSSSSLVSDSDIASPTTIFNPGDDLAAKKTRLKQWAQVVACSVRESSSSSCSNPSDQVNY